MNEMVWYGCKDMAPHRRGPITSVVNHGSVADRKCTTGTCSEMMRLFPTTHWKQGVTHWSRDMQWNDIILHSLVLFLPEKENHL